MHTKPLWVKIYIQMNPFTRTYKLSSSPINLIQEAFIAKTVQNFRYRDVTWASWHLKSLANRLFVQTFVHVQIKYKKSRYCAMVIPSQRPVVRKVFSCHDVIIFEYIYTKRMVIIWGLWCHKQVSRIWISNCIHSILWDAITYPYPRFASCALVLISHLTRQSSFMDIQ